VNYRILDTVLGSGIPLPELYRTNALQAEIQVDELPDAEVITDPVWLHHWMEDDEVTISTGMVNNHYILRFPGLADFVIHKSCDVIRYQCRNNLQDMTLRHLLLDQVIPRVRGQLGHLVIHASAVTLASGKTVLFVGESGAGKSTLAATCAQLGATVIADDCVLLRSGTQGPECFGNYPSLRLYAEIADVCDVRTTSENWSENTHKFNVSLLPTEHLVDPPDPGKPHAVDAIFLLNPSYSEAGSNALQVTVSQAPGADMLLAIIQQLFLVNPLDVSVSAGHFSQLSNIVNQGLPVYNINFPHDIDSRNNLYNKIEETCHNL
jgi:energy-coupling factor transporter ATP-binding protein EcfA2